VAIDITSSSAYTLGHLTYARSQQAGPQPKSRAPYAVRGSLGSSTQASRFLDARGHWT
jgi:hypothetical protein